MTEEAIEYKINAKGLNAPRLTPQQIDEKITGEDYLVHGVLTICILTLRNGYLVTGESACVSPENFDAEIGRQVARTNARDKVWLLEGYLLREREWTQPKSARDRAVIEQSMLRLKIDTLGEFLEGEAAPNLPEDVLGLLHMQYHHMLGYHQALSSRLEIWHEEGGQE